MYSSSLSNSLWHTVIAEAITNVYIKKKHYHIGNTLAKKLPMSTLYGTHILYFNPMIFQMDDLSCRKYCYFHNHIHFQDHRHEINTLLYFFFLPDLSSVDITFVEGTCYLFLLFKIYNWKFVQSQHSNSETKFIKLFINYGSENTRVSHS